MLMREPLYGGLTTLVLGLGARAFLCPASPVWPVLLGVAGAAFWLTREEGVILLPPMLLMAGWHVLARTPRLTALAGPALATATAAALVLGVCAINQSAYGVFRTNDLKGGPFARAYGAMVRVDPQRWRQLVPVPRDVRMRIYAVSAAAAELQPFLEGDSAHLGADVDCALVPKPDCHDIDGAHFLFSLRDAVARAGHYRTARDADRFYRRLAREIDAACARHALDCGAGRRGLWPQFSLRYARPLAHSLYQIAGDMMRLGDPQANTVFSLVQGADGAAYDEVAVDTPIAPAADLLTAPGWQVSGAFSVADPGGRMAVVGPSGTIIQSELRQSVNVGISDALHHPPGQGQGFSADVRCQPGNCSLALTGAAGTLGSWPLATLAPGVVLNTPVATVFVDKVVPLPPYASALYRPTLRVRAMRACARLLPVLTETISVPALAWAVLRAVRDLRRRSVRPLTVLLLALALTVADRLVLLSLLDATTVAVQFRYEAPAFGALLCLVGLTLGRICIALPGARGRTVARRAPACTASTSHTPTNPR